MTTVNGNAPKITLYTNHGCPYAHRAHIVVKELGLQYDEVIIDLTKPREPSYLEVNPVSCIFARISCDDVESSLFLRLEGVDPHLPF